MRECPCDGKRERKRERGGGPCDGRKREREREGPCSIGQGERSISAPETNRETSHPSDKQRFSAFR